jgi:hypothetical protein
LSHYVVIVGYLSAPDYRNFVRENLKHYVLLISSPVDNQECLKKEGKKEGRRKIIYS